MGDPAGVGPETILGAWGNPRWHDSAHGVVVGHAEIMRRAARLLHSPIEVVEVSTPDELRSHARLLPCLTAVSDDALDAPVAVVDARSGQAAYDTVVRATQMALAGSVAGIVTAPLHKAALHAAGHHYPGHTELLAELCGVDDFAMMLYLASGNSVRGRVGLGVVHVTLHTALRNVFEQLTVESILSRIRLAEQSVQAMLDGEGIAAAPRIAVAALNPHGGEQGLFGDEETRIIAPATQLACAEGINAAGPLPVDTLLAQAVAGEYDAVVAMYHDQGHIALKLLDMHHAVNVTLGLPIVRTSVAHGTAFDLAWQGRAQTSGMVESIRVAGQLVGQRQRVPRPI